MNEITILTSTRAEYGLLSPIIHGLKDLPDFKVSVIATGAHLSPEFGLTYKEIEKDGIKIDKKIEILLSADTPSAISKSMGLALISFADYFEEHKTDGLLVLGDRYETLSVCCAAMNAQIPIIHLYGGETTEGAVDEAIRHAITKLSYIHLTSTEEYRKRVIQLGENPERVFTVGAIGVENALRRNLMSKDEVAYSLGINPNRPYAVVTFHPVTLEKKSAEEQCSELLRVFDNHSEVDYIITKSNADCDGRIVNKMLEEYVANNKNARLFDSLGTTCYLSALKHSEMVIGNSSSGLIEAPSFHIPTINIGDRQKGRIKAASVIDCEPNYADINNAIGQASSIEFKKICQLCHNPYEGGDTTSKILNIIQKIMEEKIILKKSFYNIDFS